MNESYVTVRRRSSREENLVPAPGALNVAGFAGTLRAVRSQGANGELFGYLVWTVEGLGTIDNG